MESGASYTQTALLAYALSNLYRQRGVVTVLGGSHARCYPHDAASYFDYVLGFTDRATIDQVLREREHHQPRLCLSAKRQPAQLPGVRERWKFIEPTIAKASAIKIIPMIGSLGCPYTCWARAFSSGRQCSSTRRSAVSRSGTTFCAPTTQIARAAPPAYAGSWLPLPDADTSDPFAEPLGRILVVEQDGLWDGQPGAGARLLLGGRAPAAHDGRPGAG